MKKIIIAILIIVGVTILINLALRLTLPKRETTFLDIFNEGLKSITDMDKFAEKNIDFKTSLAYKKAIEYTNYPYDEQTFLASVKDFKEKITDKELKEYKEEKLETYKDFTTRLNPTYNYISEEREDEYRPLLKVRTVLPNSDSVYAKGYYLYYYDGALIDMESYQYVKNFEKDPLYLYNSKAGEFVGEQIEGSYIQKEIDEIISLNTIDAKEKNKRFIGIKVKEGSIANYNDEESLYNACQKANSIEYGTGKELSDSENTEENVNKANEQMKNLKTKINNQKLYKVTAKSYNGVIVWIIIEGPDGEK